MAGDFSRTLFDQSRHYSGVLMQQGRVQLDADWNEQLALQQHRILTEAVDVVGTCGAPKEGGSFSIAQTPRGDDLLITPGRFYAGGLLCELNPTSVPITFPQGTVTQALVPNVLLDGYALAAGQWVEISAAQVAAPLLVLVNNVDTNDPVSPRLTFDTDISAYQNAGPAFLRRMITYATQPDFPTPDFTTTNPLSSGPSGGPVTLLDGTYLVLLEAWQREVNALEDPRIREVALGGPDSTERLQTVWQVKLLPVNLPASPLNSPLGSPLSSPMSSPITCDTDFPEWDQQIAPMSGLLNAQTVTPSGTDNPCVLPPSAGYQRLENQLYRIEIFQGGATRDQSFFVWSRDNATVETTITHVDGIHLYLRDLGRDEMLGFAKDQWVEIVSRADELQGAPRFLAQIIQQPDPSDNNKVTLSASAAAYAGRSDLRLRRWDISGASVTSNGLPITPGWIDLEAGIQIQFSEGSYSTRAYWQIPARTATGEIEWPPFQIPNTDPVPQPPLGINRYYCKLARLDVINQTWFIFDCRKQFPSLTSICADDVCYHNQCDMPGVTTVQEALDQLCVAADLRSHNKYLHGWGIVCGLEVTCGPDDQNAPREHITVHTGRAIDCDGNEIIVQQDTTLNVLDMLLTSPPNYTVPDNDYCLILDPSVPGRFRFETYDPKSSEPLFDDTLLMEFIAGKGGSDHGCILSLSDFFNSQFKTPAGSTDLVSPAQKRLTTIVINLFAAQYGNPDNGSYVFLSPREDQILRDFFDALRDLLKSKTYCAMFQDIAFPQYPFANLGMNTIFGKGFKTRMRVDPTGSRAYTVGGNNVIGVYDLQQQQMVAELQFPAGTGAVVNDVAFSPDGSQVYGIANLNSTDTAFAVASVSSSGQHTWGATTVVCGVILLTLAEWTSAAGKTMVCAVSANGLYIFDPTSVSTTPLTVYDFNGFGHLVIDQGSNFAYATASTSTTTPITSFNQVVRLDLANVPMKPAPSTSNPNPQTPPTFVYPLTAGTQTASGNDSDDIAVVPASQLPGQVSVGQLYVTATVSGQPGTQLFVFPSTGTSATPLLANPVNLDEATATSVRLAYNQVTDFLMITFEDSYRIKLYRPGSTALETYRGPVQVQPIAIVFQAQNGMVYVWNDTSSTITCIPAALLNSANPWQLASLLQYRVDAITAYLKLLGGGLQYLKDCFCDRLIVDCPSCDEDDHLYLACISMRQGQVFKVCNFSKRKYVKSFPTIGYWLSLIPIVPLLHMAVEKFCCAALPNMFGNFKVPQPQQSVVSNPSTGSYKAGVVSAKIVRSTIATVQTTSIKKLVSSAGSKTLGSKKFLKELSHPAMPKPIKPLMTISSAEIVGQSVDSAKTKLQGSNISVGAVVPYDPGQPVENIRRYATAPERLQPGAAVSLVTDQSGKVVYYTVMPPEVNQLSNQVQASQQQVTQNAAALNQVLSMGRDLKAQLDATQQALTTIQPALSAASNLQEQVTLLNTRLANLQVAQAQELAVRDQTIKSLNDQVQAQLSTVNDLKTQVQKLARRPRPAGPG